jgi:UDP-N-acetylglucosamine--dolichyl-phosphate N-acetylglucosaminephosphotransferase
MNKAQKNKVAGSGGLMAVLGFILGTFSLLAIYVFSGEPTAHLVPILALLCTVMMLSGIGFIDDLLGWRHGGLSKRSRLILVLFAAVPLIAINAGKHTMGIPFLGTVDIGLLYPLFILPLGILGASTTFNFFAGFNGLEAGIGILLLSGSAIVSFSLGETLLGIISLVMVFSLFAFVLFNFYPASVFPGDSLTYAIGGLFAVLCILGNFERIALFFFIPVIIEVILKSRGKLVKHSFGKPNKDGTLSLMYDRVYGSTHLAILVLQKLRIPPTERKVVVLLLSYQAIFIMLGLFLFRGNLFN